MNTLNSYLREVVDLAESLGYDVMELEARGFVRLVPKKGNPEQTIEFNGLYPLDLMRKCLRDLTEKPS